MAIPSDFPPVVYVPCAEGSTDPQDARVEYRRTRDGREALLVYSALDRLTASLGPHQPWLLIPILELEKVWEADQFDLVLLDVEVPQEHWTTPGGQA